MVLEGENLRPLSRPQREIFESASWAMKTRVVGSGPEISIVPSSANPMMRTFDLSNSLSRLSKARFHATGLKTPPWGVPLVRNLTIVLSKRVDWQDLVFM